MSDVSDNNRFTPPKAALADPLPPAGSLVLAGRGRRLGAVMLDGVLSWVVLLASMFALGHSYFSEAASMEDPGSMSAIYAIMFRSFGPGLVIVVAIQAWFLHSHGGTLGKKLLGMRIVRTDGSRAGFVRLFFVRAGIITVVSMIPLLGGLVGLVDMVLIFRDSRQCLHDNIADTIVVMTPSAPAQASATPA